jgi:hypothetical protein
MNDGGAIQWMTPPHSLLVVTYFLKPTLVQSTAANVAGP